MLEQEIQNCKTHNNKSGTHIYGTLLLDGILNHGTPNLENIRGQKDQNSAETQRLPLPPNTKMMNMKVKKREHFPELLKGKHFLKFILCFSYKFFRKFPPIFKSFSHSFLRFSLKFLGELPPSQNIPVLLKKFCKISSQLVYIHIVTESIS